MAPNCFACRRSGVRPDSSHDLTFYKFPSDDTQRKVWIQVLLANGMWNNISKNATMICSDHFEESAIDRTGPRPRLREGACPTLFSRSNKKISKVTQELLCLDWPESEAGFINSDLKLHVTALVRGRNSLRSRARKLKAASRLLNAQPTEVEVDVPTRNSKKKCNYNFADPAGEKAASQSPGPSSPKNVTEALDPLFISREEAKHMVLEDNFSTENTAMDERMLVRLEGNSFDNCKVEGEPVSECRIKVFDAETEDQPEYNEILTVNECKVVEDCQQIEESSFEFTEKTNGENGKREDHTNVNGNNIATDYRCDVCSAVLDDESELNSHKRRCLLAWKPFDCNVCKKRFWDQKLLKEHKYSHWLIDCSNCGRSFSKKSKKQTPCPHCNHVSNKTWLNTKSSLRRRVSNGSSKSSNQNGKNALKAGRTHKQSHEVITVPDSCDQSNLTDLLEVKAKQEETQEVTVDLDNYVQPYVESLLKEKVVQDEPQYETINLDDSDQSNDGSVLLICSEPEEVQEGIVVDCNSDHSYSKCVCKTPKKKKKQAIVKRSVKVVVEEPVPICEKCDRHFASASDFRAHTQLVLCKKKNLQPVANLTG